ncbi:hypothetical protein FOZ63_016594 [Perkinsus olseni]|uniref:Uncharacterized protein n=1 Tax=Perkinsus olseni TaxID=32597 RepID=A0A7J6QNN0_PEROL|nr:hypothetical protein FOZ63_016594 [Perkinsus olseni]
MHFVMHIGNLSQEFIRKMMFKAAEIPPNSQSILRLDNQGVTTTREKLQEDVRRTALVYTQLLASIRHTPIYSFFHGKPILVLQLLPKPIIGVSGAVCLAISSDLAFPQLRTSFVPNVMTVGDMSCVHAPAAVGLPFPAPCIVVRVAQQVLRSAWLIPLSHELRWVCPASEAGTLTANLEHVQGFVALPTCHTCSSRAVTLAILVRFATARTLFNPCSHT